MTSRVTWAVLSVALCSAPAVAGVWGAHDQFLSRLTTGVELEAVELDRFGQEVATGDFNNDGFGDVAVGVPGAVVGGDLDAGSVHVFYGSANGLRSDNDVVFDQDMADVAGAAETGDRWGQALAVGDFNADSFDDLAIGAPLEDIGSVQDAGAIWILYGSAGGLTAAGSDDFNQSTSGVPGDDETDDLMGLALAAGDFDDDGFDDLAVGAPGESLTGCTDTSRPNEGRVMVFFGGAGGLGTSALQDINTGQINGVGVFCGIEFGEALAAGDFDADGFDDLAIGTPLGTDNASGSNVLKAGEVYVLGGSSIGLDVDDNEVWAQDMAGVPGTSDPSDLMGKALAAGDFDGDGRADLAIGIPFDGDGSGEVADRGGVLVLRGSASLLTTTNALFIDQGNESIPDTQEANDRFGNALAAGDFDGDGRDDLAIGAAEEDFGGDVDAGIVMILPGTPTGLVQNRTQVISQNLPGVFEDTDPGDEFGFALASGDINGDGVGDLLVGSPGHTIGAGADAGALHLLRGALFAADFEDGAGTTEWDSAVP